MKVTFVHGNIAAKPTAVAIGIPNGIGVMAAYLESLGYEVEIIDAPILEMTPETAALAVEASRPDLVGVTSMTPSFPTASRLASLVKEALPGVPIIFGGPHVHFTSEVSLKENPWIDACCRGDGEDVMAELCARWSAGDRRFDGIKGLSYRLDGKIVHEPERPRIDIADLPITAYHLLPMDLYHQRQTGDFSETFSPVRVMASRGCPYPCSFCLVPKLFDKTYRFRNPQKIADELEILHKKYKITSFKFADDTLTLNKKPVIEVCDEMHRRGVEMLWECETRIDLVNDPLLESMHRAGCRAIWFGTESAKYDSIQTYEKKIKLENLTREIQRIQKHGIRAGSFFIVGLPTETAEECRNSVRFAIDLGLDFSVYSIATPYPGTTLTANMYDLGVRNVSTNWSEFTESEAVWDTKYLTKQEINLLMVQNYMDYYGRYEYVIQRDTRRRLGLTQFVMGFVGELLEGYGVISSADIPNLGPPQRTGQSPVSMAPG